MKAFFEQQGKTFLIYDEEGIRNWTPSIGTRIDFLLIPETMRIPIKSEPALEAFWKAHYPMTDDGRMFYYEEGLL